MLNPFFRRSNARMAAAAGLALCASAALPQLAQAQVAQRAAFVGNNGNIEGSVTSFTFNAAGEPQFVQHLVLGSGSGQLGNNVYAIALSPSGKYLATTHATGATPRLIHILRIHEDATMTLVGAWPTPPTPLDAEWISDEVLAVTESNSSTPDSRIITYHFDEAGETLTEIGKWVVGSFSGAFAISPDRKFLYAENGGLSGPTWVRIFQIESNGALTYVQTEYTSSLMLGLSISPNGKWLYAGGGISAGGNAVPAYGVDESTGLLSWVLGSPFYSPGSSPSPKQAIASNDNQYLFVGHGRSAAVRSFAIEQQTGALTDTGHAVNVGGQGDHGTIAMLDDMVLFTRQYSSSAHGPSGLLSYTIQPDGSFTLNGQAPTGATRPFGIAAWSPAETICYANCDGSTSEPILTVDDFTCFINEFAAAQTLPHEQQLTHYSNCDNSTQAPVLNVDDFTCFINEFAAGCP